MKKLTLALVAIAMIAAMSIQSPAAEATTGEDQQICVKARTTGSGAEVYVIKYSDRGDHGEFECSDKVCPDTLPFCATPPAPKAPQQAYPDIVNAPQIKILGDISFDQAALDSWAAANPAPAYVAHDFTPGNVDPAEWAAYLAK